LGCVSSHNTRMIPEVGPITAVSFIAEIVDIGRFEEAKKLVAFVGLDSRVHQSGTSVHGKGYISKRGSEGKLYRVALVATMNKMTHVIHSVWTNNKPFEDQRIKPKEDKCPL